MTVPDGQRTIGSGRLKARLYGLAFVDEFGPIYAVYTLWFNDNGISTSQISYAFILWAVVTLVLELPTGVLADRVDRRYLLVAAFAIRAAGLTIWLLWPTLPGLLVGTALWATQDALASGAWEATIHDQLRAVGSADRYGVIMARVSQSSHLGVAVGTLVGAGLLRLDVSLVVLGWLTVAVHAGSITLTASLPFVDPNPESEGEPVSDEPDSWWATLRAGLVAARRQVVIGQLLVLGALIEGLFLFDEYLPLLARDRGGADDAAPIIILVVWLGLLAGGELVARAPGLSGAKLGSLVLVGAIVASGAIGSGLVWPLALVAVTYIGLEATVIVADARLQERADPAVRATVASVRGFGAASISMVILAIIAVTSDGNDPTPGLHVLAGALAVTALGLMVWLPKPAGAGPDRLGAADGDDSVSFE